MRHKNKKQRHQPLADPYLCAERLGASKANHQVQSCREQPPRDVHTSPHLPPTSPYLQVSPLNSGSPLPHNCPRNNGSPRHILGRLRCLRRKTSTASLDGLHGRRLLNPAETTRPPTKMSKITEHHSRTQPSPPNNPGACLTSTAMVRSHRVPPAFHSRVCAFLRPGREGVGCRQRGNWHSSPLPLCSSSCCDNAMPVSCQQGHDRMTQQPDNSGEMCGPFDTAQE